jgi:hypothetical protein
MVIAMFMILEQLQIAPEIVRIAFAAVMFAIALALALAFGLGGRDVAARMLEDADRKGRENADQIKRDFAQGRERAAAEARRADPTQPEQGVYAQTPVQGGYAQPVDPNLYGQPAPSQQADPHATQQFRGPDAGPEAGYTGRP